MHGLIYNDSTREPEAEDLEFEARLNLSEMQACLDPSKTNKQTKSTIKGRKT